MYALTNVSSVRVQCDTKDSRASNASTSSSKHVGQCRAYSQDIKANVEG